MKKALVSPLIILILVAISTLSLLGTGCARSSQKVLIIFSYNQEYTWVADEEMGINEVFQGKGYDVQKFYLDTKRQTGAEWFQKIAADAIKKIDEYKPDVVVVFDDNACDLVARKYTGQELPFVFAGVNADPAVYGFPAKNVTGAIERYNVASAIELLKKLAPNVKKAAVLTDASVTSQEIIKDIKSQSPALEMSYYAIDDFSEWQSTLKYMQTLFDAIGIFQYHTLRNADNSASLPPQDVLKWTIENNRLPEFTFFDFAVKDGVLCGAVTSGYEQGKAAADIAVRILQGEKPSGIPVARPDKSINMVNQSRAEQLHLTIPDAVLSGATVVK